MNSKIYFDHVMKLLCDNENVCLSDLKKEFLGLFNNDCKLYKFRSNDTWHNRDKSLFEKNQIYIPSLNQVNDPFELSLNVDFFNGKLKYIDEARISFDAYKKCQVLFEDELEKIELMKDRCAAFSLSEEKDNILLWSYYANNHRGYCVEYDASEIFDQFMMNVLPVRYQYDMVRLFSMNPRVPEAQWQLAYLIFTTKAECWKHEKEWRIIKTVHEKESHYLEFPRPTAVYLGCAVEMDFQKDIIATCSNQKVPVFQMKKSRNQYKLNVEKIL